MGGTGAIGLLAVNRPIGSSGWTTAARAQGLIHARSHIERLLGRVPAHCTLITVVDGHPATLAWMGSVHGHRTRRGVEHFGQTGTIASIPALWHRRARVLRAAGRSRR